MFISCSHNENTCVTIHLLSYSYKKIIVLTNYLRCQNVAAVMFLLLSAVVFCRQVALGVHKR